MIATDLQAKLERFEASIENGTADGDLLEELVEQCAGDVPDWEVSDCWPLRDYPRLSEFGLEPYDDGIDLIAEKTDGRRVAIQCKAVSNANVTTTMIQKFAGKANKFDERWLVTSAQQTTTNARALQECNVLWKDALAELPHAFVEPDGSVRESEDPRTAMQDEAVAECIESLRNPPAELLAQWREDGSAVPYLPQDVGRTKLVLPCGTGKTRVSMRIVEELCSDGDLAVVLVPSIALIGQVRLAYLQGLRAAGRDTVTIAVCSDKTAGLVKSEEKPDADPTRDTGHTHAVEVGCRVAESPAAVQAFVNDECRPDRLNLIFSTYQSGHHVAEALRKTERYAEVLVCDEAHRTAQIKQIRKEKVAERIRNFTLCHDQVMFPARYRLYQTATPKIFSADNQRVQRIDRTKYAINDMGDQGIFGPEGYRRSYQYAVDHELLTDYRIIAFGVDEQAWEASERICREVDRKQRRDKKGKLELSTSEALAWLIYGIVLYGGANAADGQVRIRSSIAFLNRTARSSAMAKWLRSPEAHDEICRYFGAKGLPEPDCEPDIQHLDAGHPASKRRVALHRLTHERAGDRPQGISNVGIFGEGTDTPSLDAVAILATRKSPTDVIQIVGRCMRRSPDKTKGYVIVPVPLPRGLDAETSLGRHELGEEWKPLSQILTALRAHDGRIENRVHDLVEIYMPPALPENREKEVVVVAQDGEVTRTGIWRGPESSSPEHVIAEAKVPAWRERPGKPPMQITDYLTEERGFVWSDQKLPKGRATGKLTDRPEGEDDRTLTNAGDVLAIRRDRRGTRVTGLAPVGRKDAGAEGFDITDTVEKARKLAANRSGLREPRRRISRKRDRPSAQAEPTLWQRLESEEPTRNLAVEVMERSGLRGNATRDFNLLLDIVAPTAAALRTEHGVKDLLENFLGMESGASSSDAKSADGCTVAVLLMLNALILHGRLEKTTGQVARLIGENTLRQIAAAEDPCDVLAEAWMSVLEYDYRPVFQPARNVVRHLGKSEHRTAAWRAIRRLAAWADENAEHYATMGMEYAGQLFSRVMGHQAADGAYFTRPEAARLLAELAIDEMGVTNWNDPAEWAKLKVADLACGSGTLLNAWIEGVKDRMRALGADEPRCAAWHKKAVEELTTGLDINQVSLQLAAGRFTLGNLHVDYRKMALHCLEHGRVGADVRLGALELLGDDEIIGRAPDSFKWEDDDVVHPDVKSALTGTRAVLVNPPFSDNTKRNRNVDVETKEAMQEREKSVRDRVAASDPAAGELIDINSIRTFFTPLIDSVLREKTGVLAKILPMTACTAASGLNERQFLASRFWIKYVLMCHDPTNINLSQETGINECLLIGTRRGAGEGRPTTFVNLSRYPQNTADVHAITASLRERNFNAIGQATEWPVEQVQAGDWSPVQWYSGQLATASTDLRHNVTLPTAGSLYDFSIKGGNVMHCFEPIEGNPRTHGRLRILTSIAEERRSHLAGDADATWQIIPVEKRDKRGGTDAVPKYVDEQGWMLAAQRFRTTSSRTTSQYTAEPALGTAYIAIRTDSPEEAKVLNLLWNSTPVLIQLLSMRSKSAAYIHWSSTQLQSVKLPADAREPKLVQALAGVHDELVDLELGRLQYAADDPVRATIDDATAELFDLSRETVAEWRTWLSQEPFMHNASPIDD